MTLSTGYYTVTRQPLWSTPMRKPVSPTPGLLLWHGVRGYTGRSGGAGRPKRVSAAVGNAAKGSAAVTLNAVEKGRERLGRNLGPRKGGARVAFPCCTHPPNRAGSSPAQSGLWAGLLKDYLSEGFFGTQVLGLRPPPPFQDISCLEVFAHILT